jgi:hypothetical protein
VQNLDGDMDLAGLGNAARCHQPGGHLGKSLSAVLEDFLADLATITVRQKHMMALARPIDAGIPSSFILKTAVRVFRFDENRAFSLA